MKQKTINNQIDAMKQANYASMQVLDYLLSEYTFKTNEEEQINHMQKHLLNMNVLFTKIQDGNKKNDKVV